MNKIYLIYRHQDYDGEEHLGFFTDLAKAKEYVRLKNEEERPYLEIMDKYNKLYTQYLLELDADYDMKDIGDIEKRLDSELNINYADLLKNRSFIYGWKELEQLSV